MNAAILCGRAIVLQELRALPVQRRALSSLGQRAHVARCITARVRGRGWNVEARRPFASGEKGEDSHDDFKPKRKSPPADLDEAVKLIGEQVKKHRIMLYMKGTPSQPMCGFSAQVVRVLHASGVDFDSVNVLDYPMIREGVKVYGNWPTIPQMYLDGELVGGCDIITSLFQSGELSKMLEESEKKAQKA